MAAKLEEITGLYLGTRHRFDDTIIADVELTRLAGVAESKASAKPCGWCDGAGDVPCACNDGQPRPPSPPSGNPFDFDDLLSVPAANVATIKGPAEPDELQLRQLYRFYGRWTSYNNRRTGQTEKQFHFQSFVRPIPHGREGVIRYLQTAPHIGQARATLLWEAYAGNAAEMLRTHPDQAAMILSISDAKAREAAVFLASEVALEACTIDMIDLLGGRGFPRDTAKKAVNAWGNKAAEFIRRNPYILMNFRGCGYKKTDAMYLDLQLPPGKLKRQALSAWYTLARDSEGHTWFSVEQAVHGIRSHVAGAELNPQKAIKLALRHDRMRRAAGYGGGLLAKIRTRGISGPVDPAGDRLWLAEGKKAAHEAYIAERVADALVNEDHQWPIESVIANCQHLSDHQLDRLTACLTGAIAILAGSPGTGKTYSAAQLIKLIIALAGVESIAVAAPTGKAAVRITEAMQAYQIPIKARTIHSLLGVASRDSIDGWGFEHGPGNPLPQQFIVVDESSMIDTDLMASLIAARARGTHVLFVGDPNQLPPVGHGAPLRDMIAAGVPYGELREIKRQDGSVPNAIIQACADIRDGKRFQTSPLIDPDAGLNLYNVAAANPEEQVAKMLRSLEVARQQGMNPVWDCQVLVAVNAKARLSRKDLNKDLQRALNPNPGIAGSPFIVADKVVNTKNGFFSLADGWRPGADVQTDGDGKVFVANGELAEVLAVEEKLFTLRLSGPERVIKVPRGKAGGAGGKGNGSDGSSGDESEEDKTATGCTWDLGYALSVHKSQGSEWPLVVYMIDEYPGARRVCSREHIYTGISRAKRVCLLIGKKIVADGFAKRPSLHKRKTFLKELLMQNMERCKAEREAMDAVASY